MVIQRCRETVRREWLYTRKCRSRESTANGERGVTERSEGQDAIDSAEW